MAKKPRLPSLPSLSNLIDFARIFLLLVSHVVDIAFADFAYLIFTTFELYVAPKLEKVQMELPRRDTDFISMVDASKFLDSYDDRNMYPVINDQ